MKKLKKPQTIADLKIEWTFETPKETFVNFKLFNKLNPTLKNVKLEKGQPRIYFIFNEIRFSCTPFVTSEESLSHYIDFLSYMFYTEVGKKVKLSHFEKLSDTEYRIHGKEL